MIQQWQILTRIRGKGIDINRNRAISLLFPRDKVKPEFREGYFGGFGFCH